MKNEGTDIKRGDCLYNSNFMTVIIKVRTLCMDLSLLSVRWFPSPCQSIQSNANECRKRLLFPTAIGQEPTIWRERNCKPEVMKTPFPDISKEKKGSRERSASTRYDLRIMYRWVTLTVINIRYCIHQQRRSGKFVLYAILIGTCLLRHSHVPAPNYK